MFLFGFCTSKSLFSLFLVSNVKFRFKKGDVTNKGLFKILTQLNKHKYDNVESNILLLLLFSFQSHVSKKLLYRLDYPYNH